MACPLTDGCRGRLSVLHRSTITDPPNRYRPSDNGTPWGSTFIGFVFGSASAVDLGTNTCTPFGDVTSPSIVIWDRIDTPSV
jgi:hypothetical protein